MEIKQCPVCGRRMSLVPAIFGCWVWSCPVHDADSWTITTTTPVDSARITYQINRILNPHEYESKR